MERAMSALGVSCCLVGPVPWKEVVADDGKDADGVFFPPEEYADIIATMPRTSMVGRELIQHQGIWIISKRVPGIIAIQRRFVPRTGDVFLASAPKCGTTWIKALSFATMARAMYRPTSAQHPLLRLNPHHCVPMIDDLFSAGQEAKLDALPSPRVMNTHIHHSLLPPSISMADCKIVYICRDPKDMLVSMWHFLRSVMPVDTTYTFSDMFECACEGKTPYGPIHDSILGYWRASQTHPDQVLFLRYEEVLLHPARAVRELARFLGVPFTAAEEATGTPGDIVELCSIKTMRGRQANRTGEFGLVVRFPSESLFRKGVAGDWQNHMTLEMARRFDRIVADKLRGSGLTFNSCLN